jgi:molecular chaperone GrpE
MQDNNHEPVAEATVDGSAELEAARKEAQANLENWQRERADFQNYKRRIERDLKESRQNATLDVLKSLLPIVDDFERAMANIPEEAQGQPWLEGINLIQRKFARVLEDNNITILDPVGEPFDPSRHQALGTDDSSEIESGHVTETLQKGYLSGDIILRPALVKVAG